MGDVSSGMASTIIQIFLKVFYNIINWLELPVGTACFYLNERHLRIGSTLKQLFQGLVWIMGKPIKEKIKFFIFSLC